jgi:DNA-binding PadR family transcriptional regulator
MGRSPSHHAVLILASVADEERHGYAIKKDVEHRTAGDVRLGSTSLYRLLGQLLDEGLIAERATPGADVDPRRRYYRITTAGRRALTAELARLERVLVAARASAGRRSS